MPTKQNISKTTKENSTKKLGGNDTKTFQQMDARETVQFFYKIWRLREHDKKAEWISNMAKELEGLEEGPKAEIHIDTLRMTLENIKSENTSSWWITWILDQEIHRHSLVFEINRCLQ